MRMHTGWQARIHAWVRDGMAHIVMSWVRHGMAYTVMAWYAMAWPHSYGMGAPWHARTDNVEWRWPDGVHPVAARLDQADAVLEVRHFSHGTQHDCLVIAPSTTV